MCGRMGMHTSPSWRQLYDYYNIVNADDDPIGKFIGNLDIAPSTVVPIVAERYKERRMTLARWGILPSWAKTIDKSKHLFNARVETITEQYQRWREITPSLQDTVHGAFWGPFRDARRCLLPMSGYYEWKNGQPYWFRFDGKSNFSVAGLWDWNTYLSTKEWPKGILSCTMITVTPNDQVAPIHNRMPAILKNSEYDAWLSPDTPYDEALALLKPWEGPEMLIDRVARPGAFQGVNDNQVAMEF